MVLEELGTWLQEKLIVEVMFVVALLVVSVRGVTGVFIFKTTSVICMDVLLDDNSRFKQVWSSQEFCKFTDSHLKSSSHSTSYLVRLDKPPASLTSVSCASLSSASCLNCNSEF